LVLFTLSIPRELQNRQVLKTQILDTQTAIDRAAVNANNGGFILQFDDDMRQIYLSTSVSAQARNLPNRLVVTHKWLDSRTLYVEVNQLLDDRIDVLSIGFHNIKNEIGETAFEEYRIELTP
jgi:hypothetical protein